MFTLKTKKPISTLVKICTVILAFLVMIFSSTLYLDIVPPKQLPEHNNLFTLFNSKTGETNSFLRLDRLSKEFFYVGAHGNTNGSADRSDAWIEDRRSSEIKFLNPNDAAQLIRGEKSRRNLASRLPIFLLGCNTGTGNKPYALELSRYLSEDIYAVNGWLVVDQLGVSRTGHGGFIASYLNYGNFEVRRFRHGIEISI